MTVLVGMILILIVPRLFRRSGLDDADHPALLHAAGRSSSNIDPIWFGVIFLICMQLGLLHAAVRSVAVHDERCRAPPTVTMNQIYVAALPYVLFASRSVLVAIILFLPIATWLPRMIN